MPGEALTNLGAGLPAWSMQLREAGYDDVVTAFDDDKMKNLRALERLGLPRYRTSVTGVTDFLADPTPIFNELDLEWYMVVLNPHSKQDERKRKFGIPKTSISEFITASLGPDELSKYDVILQESFIHCYGGNLVCSSDGTVTVELIKGEFGHNDLVVARKNPGFVMHRNPFTRLFKTEVSDDFGEIEPDLPPAIWKAVLAVPHTVDTGHAAEFALRGLDFKTGYYEFYLDRRTPESTLEPFFIDCNAGSLFADISAASQYTLAELANLEGPTRSTGD